MNHKLSMLLFLVCIGAILFANDLPEDDEISEHFFESAAFRLDVRTSSSGRILHGTERVSPIVETENANARLTVDGAVLAGWSVELPQIDSTKLVDKQWHVVSLNEGYGTFETKLLPMNRDDVVVHEEGVLDENQTNQTWSAKKIHIVRYWLRVPQDVTLTVEPGAVVKFCENTGIQVDGTLVADKAIFTSIMDDESDGDDTDVNGSTATIGYGLYDITGNGVKSLPDHANMHCAATLFENTTWKEGDIIHIMGQLKVPTGVTLNIQTNAVLKFATGAELKADGGRIYANGAMFTHIADDSVEAGGDTNADGGATLPVHDVYTLTGFSPEADCDIRYKTIDFPKIIDGTPEKPTRIMGNRVYKVTQDVIIGNGYKLVIEPGTILKMDKGKTITVESGGTLEAIGNRAQPIVFTSIKDDAHGGDTNEDEDDTTADGADWTGVYVSGTMIAKYAMFMYGGPGNERGIVESRGGLVDLDCCTIAHSAFDGLWTWGNGTMNISNSLIWDVGMGVCPYTGTNTYTNCVFYETQYGVMYWGGWTGSASFTNCIFNKCSRGWLDLHGATSFRPTFSNCLFYNPAEYGPQSFVKVGSNGNIWADPLFMNAQNGDFTLKAGSPCIDAGDGTVAPETDYWGKPRMDVVKVADGGIPNADGVCPDIGIYEMAGTYNGACPNMTVMSVIAPPEAEAGKSITVSWTITNEGNDDVVGPWRDIIVLQGDDVLGGQVVTVGETSINGTLRPLDSVTVERTFLLPPLKAGNWRIGVTTNAYRDVYEVKRTDNQTFAKEKTSVTLPVWSSSNNTFMVTGYGETGFALPKSNTARIVTVVVPTDIRMSAYGADGYLPSSSNSDVKSLTLSDGKILLQVPAGTENAYVTLSNEVGASATATVAVVDASLSLLEALPTKILNHSTSTMHIIGTGLSTDSVFKLTLGSEEVTGKTISLEDGLVAAVQFDVESITVGEYMLSVTESGQTVSLSNRITVIADGIGPRLHAWLETPATVRDGRIYTAWLCYKNTGDADMRMPLFEIAPNSTTKLALNISDVFKSESLFMAGIGKTAPAGILKTGEENRIPFFFTLKGNYVLNLKPLDDNYSGELPDGFEDLDDYRQRMSEVATRLNLRGREEYDSKAIQRFALRLKRELPVAAISGFLKNLLTGEPLAGLTVVANDPNGDIAESMTDANGYFQLQDLSDAEYVMGVIGGNLKEEILLTVNNQKDFNSLTLATIPYCTVHGYVQDAETGAGLPGVDVRLLAAGSLSYDEQTTTDDAGYYVFTRCPYGTYYLGSKGTKEYIGSTGVELKIHEGVSERYEAIEMRRGGSIYGVITMEDSGERVTEGQIQAKDEEDNTYEIEVLSDGSYMFDALPDGIYRMCFVSVDFTSDEGYSVEIKNQNKVECDLSVVPIPYFYTHNSFGVVPHIAKFILNESKIDITEIVSCEWDFDHDGIIDSTELEPNFTYNSTGEYTVSLTITDQTGNRHTTRKKNCITVEAPVENKLRDNVLEWDKQTDFEAVSFDEESLDFVIRNRTGKNILEGTVIVGEISEGIAEILKVVSILSGANNELTLKCVRGGLLDVFESCYFNIPFKLKEEDIGQNDQTRGVTRQQKSQGINLSGAGNAYSTRAAGGGGGGGSWDDNQLVKHIDILKSKYANIELDTKITQDVSDGTFVFYLTPFKFRYNIDWTVDMQFYPSVTLEYEKNLFSFGPRVPRIPIFSNIKIPIPDTPIVLLFSMYIDTKPKISSDLTAKVKLRSSFRKKILIHADAQMDFPVSLALILPSTPLSNYGKTFRDILIERYPNLKLTSNIRCQELAVTKEPPVLDMIDGLSMDSDAKAEIGLEIKPTLRLSLYQENFMVITGGINGHLGLKLECGTNKPTKAELSAGTKAFFSFYVLDFDSPNTNAKIEELENKKDVVGLAQLDRVEDEAEALKHLKWEKGLKYFGFKKEWEDFWHIDLGTYKAPEPDYNLEPTSGEAPLTVEFKAIDGKGTATGVFDEWIPEITGHHWRFGKKTAIVQVHDDDFGEDTSETYEEEGTYKTSLRLDVSPIPSFMRKKKSVIVGNEDNPPPGGPGGGAYGGGAVQSFDPNEISGVIGLGDGGTQRFVKPGEWLDYTVYFENKSTAAAPAQEVLVTHNLSKWLDWSTLELGEIAFNNQIQLELKGKARGTVMVPQKDTSYHVQMNAAMDETTGEFQLYLRSYDKTRQAYGYWPENVYAGFLPPNDETHCGEGHFTFRVKVRDDALDGAFINAEATIVFDVNEPITTSPAWFNWVTTEENPVADSTTLQWDTSDDTDGTTYVVNVWVGDSDPTTEAASEVVTSETLMINKWKLPNNLDVGTYYWNVTKTNGDVVSQTSTWSFDVEAVYHELIVNNGTGSGIYRTNIPVTVEANVIEDMAFTGWTATGVNLSEEDMSKSVLTFIMPDSDVTLTANYKTLYNVIVQDGSPNKYKALAGEDVKVTANEPYEGMTFDKWRVDGIDLTEQQLLLNPLTFTMPERDVTLTATYKPVYTVIVVNGKSNGMTEFTACEGDRITVIADKAMAGKDFDKWMSDDVEFVNAKDNPLSFEMPAQNVTIIAVFGYNEWPEDNELYAPAIGKNFREGKAVAFSWPRIRGAAKYGLAIVSYDRTKTFNTTVEGTSFAFDGLDADSYIWNVTAYKEDGSIHAAGTSDDFRFSVVEDNGFPVIIGAAADGKAVQLSYDTAEEGYANGEYAYQIFFFSLKTRTWTSLERTLQVVDGQAVIDLGADVSNGYLYICPVTTPESNFVEMYIE